MARSLPRTALRHFERHLKQQPLRSVFSSTRSRGAASWSPSTWWTGTGRSYATVSAADLEFGQPVHETHPHILKSGEITPGITAQEYADRRAKLAFNLADNGVAVLAAADLKYRSGAVFYPYRQESNFLYLTGFLEQDALAVIQKTGPNLGDYAFHLFCRPKDPRLEQWSGPWSGLQAAEDVFNADKAGDIHQIDTLLPPLLRSASRIYTDININHSGGFAGVAASGISSTKISTSPLQPLVNQQRAIKSPAEIANMRHAGRVSGRAITSAMRNAWSREKDLHSFLDYEFTKHGCDGPAYVPVVAGGPRGCMIHYVHNTAALADDQMVLVDAGGEYGTYVTDITRTWPVSGKFSAAQRDLYDAVLKVQRAGVRLCREDSRMSLDDIHRATESGLREELKQLGFETGGNAMDVLFPHHVGHYVGLDVHDVPGYGRSVPLRAGHCVTIEPGVYVPPDDERFPKQFGGMAIRIEDSVCVDETGPLVLTTEAVKEVVDIEALRD
ncbi:peptidase M24, structural domain-containing protein [Apodospora peruviana]|uniref:Xaa-Pro aminopeptidase n=1 Tax=Apodospora peruviana TaxID=516989 RepID=A0AAE0M364_9PEZI|nr:peptidase M24, structural domain-containing protein [Apodospora peruviana]